MRYLGGKSKVGKHIATAILAHTDRRGDYYEPFLGGGATFARIAPLFERAHAGDIHEDLILMWEAARAGWVPPVIDEADYRRLRDEPPSALRGFAGFGCSFGGKWWGGFARGGGRCHPAESSRNVVKTAEAMRGTVLRRSSYEEWNPDRGSVVYADPPYRGATEYAFDFDHERFWSTMHEWSDRGVVVFVSEYSAPPEWRPIWSGNIFRSVKKTDCPTTTEHLFVRA